jgi:hypothetical protein
MNHFMVLQRPLGSGWVRGAVAFRHDEVQARLRCIHRCILLRSPFDLHGLNAQNRFDRGIPVLNRFPSH